MAAEILQPSQSTIQPTQQEAPIATNAFDVGAGVFGQAAADTAQAANVQGQRAAGLFDKANAYFDRTVDQYNKIAVMNAQDEAPGLIQKDGNGQIIPPSSFWPSGIHSLAYGQAYAEAARSTYRTMAGSEFSNFVSETQAKYPTDPAAFKKAVDDKQALMLQNLDPKEAPFISLRLQQIASQGGTQVAVNLQAANNATLKAQSDVSYAAIVDTASRLAGVAAPTAAFGGKDNAAVPGAISTITGSLSPEIQKRITSSDRTPEVNAQVGGATDSAHLKAGTAVDIGTAGMTDEQKKALVSQVLASPNLRGIGFYDDHIHIDTGHDKHTVWGAVPSSVQNDVRNWQGTPTAMTAVPTSTDIEKIKTQVASSALVAGMLADWQKQAGPITTPAEIARKKDELAYTVVAKSYAEVFKSGRYDDGKGNIDQGKVALAEQNIEKIVQAFPGREDQVRKTLQEGLQFSVTQSSRFAAQQQLDDKRRIEPQQRRAMDLALQADALKNTDIDGARRITDQLRQEARAALSNPSINDAAALQLAQTYYTNGNLAKSSMQEGITNKVQGLNAVVGDPAASIDQKAAAYESAKAIRNDPNLYGQMNASQRNYLQGTMDDYVKANYGAQLEASNSVFLEGNTPPSKIAEIRKEQLEKGIIQPHQISQIYAIDQQAGALWRQKHDESQQAAEGQDAFQRGVTRTPEQQAADEKLRPLVPSGGKKQLDLTNPDHLLQAQNDYRQRGYAVKQVRDALDAITVSPDEPRVAGGKALLETIRQVEAAQVEKVTHDPTPDPNQQAMTEAKVQSIVGKNYTFLALATKFDPATAAKMVADSASRGSVGGQAGQPPGDLNSKINDGITNLAGILGKNKLGLWSQFIADPFGFTKREQDMSSEQKALRAASAAVAGQGVIGQLAASVRSGKPGQSGGLATQLGSFDNVVFEPGYAKSLAQVTAARIAVDGTAVHANVGPLGSVENSTVNTSFADSVRKGEVSFTPSADNKTLVIGFKSLTDQASQAVGVPFTQRMGQGFAAGLVEAENRRIDGSLVAVNPDYVRTLTYQAQNGQIRHYISETDRNGNTVRKMDIAADDPRLAAASMAVIKSATQAVAAASADPETYGKILAAGAVGAGPGALALLPGGDVTGNWTKMVTMISNTVQQMQIAVNRPGMTESLLGGHPMVSDAQNEAKKNLTIETTKMLQELDASMKHVKDAPNLAAVLTHMAQTHSPGFEGTGLENLIKNAGFYQPGLLPQVQTGPSRINTETRVPAEKK